MLPKDVVERGAETARVGKLLGDDGIGDEDLEDEVEEAQLKARGAPKELAEAERIRHEATHLPYR